MLEVGHWQLNETESTLTDGETIRRLTPRSMSVLIELIEHSGQLVTSEELQTRFWPNSYSGEHGLHKAISEIRTALGDDPKSPRFIKTFARRGYSFIPQNLTQSDVESGSGETSIAAPPWRSKRMIALAGLLGIIAFGFWYLSTSGLTVKDPVAGEQPISIAVLPFINMTNDPGNEFFADGLTENITYGLAQVPKLRVKARTSAFYFKDKTFTIDEIGKMLNATHILEGSVSLSGDDVRVTAQLIDTAEDIHIWAGRYDRKLADLFSVQDDITQDIVEALHLKLSPQQMRPPATISSEGFNARLQAQFFMSRLDFDRAKTLYELAIQYDPDDATAHAELANLHGLDVWFHKATIAEKLPKIIAEYESALRVNPKENTAQAVRLTVEFYVNRQYQSAINELSALIKESPDDSTLLGTYRGFMITIGRDDLALAALDRALSNNPFGADTHRVRGETLEHMGRYDEARAAYERAGELGLDMTQELGFLVLSTGDVENVSGLHDSMEEAFGPERTEVIFLKAFIARKMGDEATYKFNLQKLMDLDAYETRDSFREDVATLADDYATTSIVRMRQLSNYFPAYWSLLGSFSERREYPGLFTDSDYLKLLADVGLDQESVERIVIPDLGI